MDTLRDQAYTALGAVIDPELDEPITDLGFVRSVAISSDGDVEVHLRLPTSFCAPNFAYLMASDAKDVLTALPWTQRVVVELDDHHDSDVINAGLAADAGYRGTFGHEAEDDPRRSARHLPAQGAHRRNGALPYGAVARGPRPAGRLAGPGATARPSRRRGHRRPYCGIDTASDCPRHQTLW